MTAVVLRYNAMRRENLSRAKVRVLDIVIRGMTLGWRGPGAMGKNAPYLQPPTSKGPRENRRYQVPGEKEKTN